MGLHGNARTCPNSRRLLVVERVLIEQWPVTAAAAAAGVSERTVWCWVRRWRVEGEQGLRDRSSRPHRCPRQLSLRKVSAIRALRQLRMTAAQIAEVLSLPLSTVSRWLKRIGLGKRSRLEPPEPPNRYERRHPGELVHVDIKTLGRISERGAGHRMVGNRKSQLKRRERGPACGVTRFEHVHVMIDDHSRLAYAEVLPTLTATDAIAFLRRAVSWFQARGVQVQAVMYDNGSAFKAHAYRRALTELSLKQLRTRPYRPRTNGRIERFIQTLLNEWAYERLYGSPNERTTALPLFLERYNFHRPHSSLGHKPPASRLTNVARNYS